ncbi:MAG: MaoC family dehydratase [Janthinobacterium lividum]
MLAGTSGLHFEDLSVGQRFESGTFTVDADAIRAFATQFDPQPFHIDAEAAKHTFFDGLAASGWHTAAITMRLLVDGGLPFAGGLVGAGAEIAWPSATRPGDSLTVFSEIAELRISASKPDRGWVTVQSETRTAAGNVVQTLRARMLVARR